MTSVLNVGVMGSNPVGNQIRKLENALEAERKDKQLLMIAMETKAPEIFAEYMRLKEEVAERAEAEKRLQQAMSMQQQQSSAIPRYQPTMPSRAGGRF